VEKSDRLKNKKREDKDKDIELIMIWFFSISFLILSTDIQTNGKWPIYQHDVAQSIPDDFDCEMRKAAYDYGKKLMPRMKNFSTLWYALDLNSTDCYVDPMLSAKDIRYFQNDHDVKEQITDLNAIFVHPDKGQNSNTGTSSSPLASIQMAADLASVLDEKLYVVLNPGVYYLEKPLLLKPMHSGLTFMAKNEERAVVSGGIKLEPNELKWKPYNIKDGKNIWVADIGIREAVKGLQIDGKRLTRARYPNLPGGIEVSCGYGCMIEGKKGKWTPPLSLDAYPKLETYTDEDPSHMRNDTGGSYFQKYMVGMNGTCSIYDPPVSYWCSKNRNTSTFLLPSGVSISQDDLPNSPYQDPSDAIFFVWRPARWENWMFEIKEYDRAKNNFTFGYGGFQGARGRKNGGDFFIENVFEELDYPGEFFYDKKEGLLYVYYNATSGTPPPTKNVILPNLKTLIWHEGTQWNPVKNIQHNGITYVSTSYTYMDPHGVPSGGDWALDRIGAVFLQGTKNITIKNCIFDRLDGNGVFISGYNRNVSIIDSDFSFIGGNSIASWGYTNETEGANHPAAGIDGTDGNHPRFTKIIGNTGREIGLYEKQSSFYVQAKTAQTLIKGNVFFNGPRAGINANDGFGGGDELTDNLIFSTCRESGDHGPFNSWDRQPYITDIRTGKPSIYMAKRDIHHNFFYR